MKSILRSPWPAITLALGFGLWGLCWGLPSAERTRLLLKPELQSPAFYEQIDQARTENYSHIGLNPIAHLGRVSKGKESVTPRTILSSYSSFLARTHHGDEQQTLVMLSRINPLKGKWYPYTFQYGGAYIYPLAAYLGVLHTLHVIRLIPQATYYYAHPDQLAHVYLGARSWSLLGMIFAVCALFFIGKHLGGEWVGMWASSWFVLAPACIGNVKLAKPHVWAAAWTLWMLYFCLKAKQRTEIRCLVAAALCLGLATGTTMSQTVFSPFLLWACWHPEKQKTIQRTVIAVSIGTAVFLVTNLYIFAHFQDYRDELYYYSQFSPFKIRLVALWDFFVKVLRPSFGGLLWALSIICAGILLYSRSKKESPINWIIGICAVIGGIVSFQVQALAGDPVSSRLCLALLGLGCVWTAFALQKLPGANRLCSACLVVLVAKAVVYDLHFASDRVPKDNASLAARWMQENTPAGTLLAHTQDVPHVIEFPPVDFTRYQLISIDSMAWAAQKGPAYAILPDWAQTSKIKLLENNYVLIRRFAESPLQRRGDVDPFTTANFALSIYKKEKL